MKHYHCPVNGWDCPYYSDAPQQCLCTIGDPINECDDFYAVWGDCDAEEYTDND